MTPRNTVLTQTIKLMKEEIRNLYLAGTPISDIAKEYQVTNRNVYFHLGQLSAEDKGLHAKNLSLRLKQKKDAYAKQQADKNPPSDGNEDNPGLDDFE